MVGVGKSEEGFFYVKMCIYLYFDVKGWDFSGK